MLLPQPLRSEGARALHARSLETVRSTVQPDTPPLLAQLLAATVPWLPVFRACRLRSQSDLAAERRSGPWQPDPADVFPNEQMPSRETSVKGPPVRRASNRQTGGHRQHRYPSAPGWRSREPETESCQAVSI